MSDAPVDLYIAAYNDPDSAKADFEALKALMKSGVIFTEVAVLVSRDADGTISVTENAHEVAAGAMVGAVAGFAIALIFPPAILASTIVGGAGGAAVGKLISHGREKEIEKQADDVLPPNSSGIIAIFDEVWVDQVEKALAKAEKVDKEQVEKESFEAVKEAAKDA